MSVSSKKVVILGAGLGGLAAAALISRAGHQVTVIEGNSWVGGKSRRIDVAGQRIDTGPALVTFPGVWEELLKRFDALDAKNSKVSSSIAELDLIPLPEVGRYFFRGEETDLPVRAGHPWKQAWDRFEKQHGVLSPQLTSLLSASPIARKTLPAVMDLLKIYSFRITTRNYLAGLKWMPVGLREVIAIHTLNAGVSPDQTLAIYATMPAIMAKEGIFVPKGGVNEIPQALNRLAVASGAKVRLSEKVTSVSKGLVQTDLGSYEADVVVSGLDAGTLETLLQGQKPLTPKRVSCSGVAIYAVLTQLLPEGTATHSVIMPSSPEALHESLEAKQNPEETMTFVNYYLPNEIYPNDKATVAVLLTAPANGESYTLESEFVRKQLDLVSKTMGLTKPIDELFSDYQILDPEYFAGFGATGGALYGASRKIWQSGPFHNPGYTSRKRPWLFRVGASVHPGGGIPAVLGGAMISTEKLLRYLDSK